MQELIDLYRHNAIANVRVRLAQQREAGLLAAEATPAYRSREPVPADLARASPGQGGRDEQRKDFEHALGIADFRSRETLPPHSRMGAVGRAKDGKAGTVLVCGKDRDQVSRLVYGDDHGRIARVALETPIAVRGRGLTSSWRARA